MNKTEGNKAIPQSEADRLKNADWKNPINWFVMGFFALAMLLILIKAIW